MKPTLPLTVHSRRISRRERASMAARVEQGDNGAIRFRLRCPRVADTDRRIVRRPTWSRRPPLPDRGRRCGALGTFHSGPAGPPSRDSGSDVRVSLQSSGPFRFSAETTDVVALITFVAVALLVTRLIARTPEQLRRCASSGRSRARQSCHGHGRADQLHCARGEPAAGGDRDQRRRLPPMACRRHAQPPGSARGAQRIIRTGIARAKWSHGIRALARKRIPRSNRWI